VYETRRATARPGRNVVTFYQRGPEPSAHGIQQDPAAGDPAAHDENVPTLTGQRVEILLASIEHRRRRVCHDVILFWVSRNQ
jgi:hypothetical protein